MLITDSVNITSSCFGCAVRWFKVTSLHDLILSWKRHKWIASERKMRQSNGGGLVSPLAADVSGTSLVMTHSKGARNRWNPPTVPVLVEKRQRIRPMNRMATSWFSSPTCLIHRQQPLMNDSTYSAISFDDLSPTLPTFLNWNLSSIQHGSSSLVIYPQNVQFCERKVKNQSLSSLADSVTWLPLNFNLSRLRPLWTSEDSFGHWQTHSHVTSMRTWLFSENLKTTDT